MEVAIGRVGGDVMDPIMARYRDCRLALAVLESPKGRAVGLLTVDGAGVSDDVVRCLESAAETLGAAFGDLPRFAVDTRLYAGGFTVSGLKAQAALFARHGVSHLAFCYLMHETGFETVRPLLVEVFATEGVTLTATCRPTLEDALAWFDQD